jgi:acid phosphatase type 7
MHPNLVALLGDEQYQVGKLSDFENSFDKTYGAFKFLERPSPGNHEYYPYTKHGDNEPAQNGGGYFAYFNGQNANGDIRPQGQAGDYNKGWYSYNLGAWHIISLNAECDSEAFSHNCDPTSGTLGQETQWLSDDLAANHSPCTLAYWHQPTFSATGDSGAPPYAAFGSNEGGAADTWWKLLYQHGTDLILGGHEHVYARFKPMNPSGNVDTEKGITQFTVGTGGEALDTLLTGQALTDAHVVTGEDTAYGALKLTLNPTGYAWNFKPVAVNKGQDPSVLSYSDTGSGSCHGPAH